MTNALIDLLSQPLPGATALTISETDKRAPGEFVVDELRRAGGDLFDSLIVGGGDNSGPGHSDETRTPSSRYFHVGWTISPQHPFQKIVLRQNEAVSLLSILPPVCAAARSAGLPVDLFLMNEDPLRLNPGLFPVQGGNELSPDRWKVTRGDLLEVAHESRMRAGLLSLVFAVVLGAILFSWFWWVIIPWVLLSKSARQRIFYIVRLHSIGVPVRRRYAIDETSFTARSEDETVETFAAPLNEMLQVFVLRKTARLCLVSARQAVAWSIPGEKLPADNRAQEAYAVAGLLIEALIQKGPVVRDRSL